MDNFYFLHIESTEAEGDTIACTYDDLEGVTASGKRALKRLPEDGQFSLRLVETSRLGPESADKRTVTEFTGDADIVATVLKKKLASERKAQNEQAPALSEQTTPDIDPSV